jgi:hypothetical protein
MMSYARIGVTVSGAVGPAELGLTEARTTEGEPVVTG